MEKKQSPIFSKTYDFSIWLLNHTGKFPKSERFRLAKRLDDSLFDFYGHLLESTRPGKARHGLQRADLELDKLRLFIRISHARGLFSNRQYEYAINSLMEIGKLLGGWIKSTSKNTANPGDAGRYTAGRLVEQ